MKSTTGALSFGLTPASMSITPCSLAPPAGARVAAACARQRRAGRERSRSAPRARGGSALEPRAREHAGVRARGRSRRGAGGRRAGRPAAAAHTWMTGPSARGSEYGTPSSRMSAPLASAATSASAVASRLGSPAHRYGITAHRPSSLSAENAADTLPSVAAAAAAAAAAPRRARARAARARAGAAAAEAPTRAATAIAHARHPHTHTRPPTRDPRGVRLVPPPQHLRTKPRATSHPLSHVQTRFRFGSDSIPSSGTTAS